MALSTNPTDVLNDLEAATVTTILADSFLGNGTTTLASDISASATTLPLTSLALFSGKGEVQIEDEKIAYTGTSGVSLTGCTRGFRGTAAVEHAAGATVTHANMITVHQKLRDLNDERAYYQEELPALAVFAYGADPDAGDTFGQWDQPISLLLEIIDTGGDLARVVENVQRLLSEVRRLMRYQLDEASGNLQGMADAVMNGSATVFIQSKARGVYLVRAESNHVVTLITTE